MAGGGGGGRNGHQGRSRSVPPAGVSVAGGGRSIPALAGCAAGRKERQSSYRAPHHLSRRGGGGVPTPAFGRRWGRARPAPPRPRHAAPGGEGRGEEGACARAPGRAPARGGGGWPGARGGGGSELAVRPSALCGAGAGEACGARAPSGAGLVGTGFA